MEALIEILPMMMLNLPNFVGLLIAIIVLYKNNQALMNALVDCERRKSDK